ncbi:MAG: heavy-metal-associated domain-containing protein [Flavobacterium sp.]
MKNFQYFAVAIVLFISTTIQAQINKSEIIATGLTCSMCSNAIYKQLQSLSSVAEIDTDLNTNTFTVTAKNNQTLDPVQLKEAVEKAGFFVGSMMVYVDGSKLSKQELTLNGNNLVFLDKVPVDHKNHKMQIVDAGFVTNKQFKKNEKSFSAIADFSNSKDKKIFLKNAQ